MTSWSSYFSRRRTFTTDSISAEKSSYIHCKSRDVKVAPCNWCHSNGCSDNTSVLLQHSGCHVNTYELPKVPL